MAAKIDANLASSAKAEAPKAGKSNATMRDGEARSQAPKKHKKTPLVAVIVGVVVVAAAAAGFMFYSKAQKEKQYQEAIANADKLLADSNLVDAHAAYGQAMELMPTDTLAGKGQRTTMKLMKALVKKSMKRAQAQFDKAEYDPALATLGSLSAFEPQFSEIAELKGKCQTKKDELIEKEFTGYLAKGDEFLGKLTYAKAAEYYGKADSLKPGDTRVQDKLNSIGTKLKGLFAEEVAKGDAFMASKNHSSAAGAYARAVLYDKNNADGKAKLAKAQAAIETDKKLLMAANDNDLNDVKNLLAAGANPNYLSANQCPMGWAVYRGNLDAVKALKDAGADCNPKISYYYNGSTHSSLISLAAAVNDADVFKYLHSTCKANVASVASMAQDGGIKDYLRGLGFGGVEFKEYFTNSTSSKFPALIDEDREWSFRDGKYYLRCISEDYAGWKGAEFDIDIYKDFEVTLEVHHLSGNTSNGGIGMLYASDEDYDYVNVFAVSPNGKYHTGYYLDGWQDVVYTESSAVNKGEATNKLKIVKKGTTVYFYINDKYITSDNDVRMAGNLFGVIYGSPDGYTTVWYDNLIIRNL
jgi:predicted negative regulator of RcsB-dependent stress response